MRQVPLLFVLLLSAGCAQPGSEEAALALQDALAAHQASAAGIGGQPAAAAAARSETAPGPAGRPAPARATAGAPTMAGQLVGQTPETLRQWLGEPRLRRQEGPAEIWHYQASQCHLDLVLYREEGARPTLRVAFASARAVGAARRGEEACLRDIGRGATRPGAPVQEARARA